MQVTKRENKSKIRDVIGNIDQLPTPPFVFQQITKVLNNPKASALNIAAIISEDAAITAKILKLSNSAYYGLAQEVNSVKQAVVIIGMQTIKSLVLSSSLIDAFTKGKKVDGLYAESYWRHSLSVAIMAKIIARISRKSNLSFQEAAFSAGILHDIGKLVIATYIPEKHDIKMQYIKSNSSNEYEAELNVLDCTHVEIGQYFAESWKLPKELADAVYFHHAPASAPGDDLLPYVIHLANYLTHDSNENNFYGMTRETTPHYQNIWEKLGINPDMRDKFIEELFGEYGKAETFLHVA